MELIKYTNCWEDAYLLSSNLKVDNNSTVLSIASGGDNSLYLLASNPKQMICVDLNPAQIYLTELKTVAIRELPLSSYLNLLGFTTFTNRKVLYKEIEAHMSQEAQNYWRGHFQWIEKGVIHQGKFEKYIRLFSNRLLPFVRSKKKIVALTTVKSEQEQSDFYHQQWNTWNWRLLFRLFFNRFLMSRTGRDPEKFNEVKEDIGKVLWERTASHFQSTLAQGNYILEYIMNGKFIELPPYLKAYDDCKQWLQKNDIIYFHGGFEQALTIHPEINRMNLSNIFEYMDQATFQELTQKIDESIKEDSRLCFWNFAVPRELNHLSTIESIPVPRELDRGFFYHAFHCYKSNI